MYNQARDLKSEIETGELENSAGGEHPKIGVFHLPWNKPAALPAVSFLSSRHLEQFSIQTQHLPRHRMSPELVIDKYFRNVYSSPTLLH